MTKSEAKRKYGVEFGKLTTSKDSVGEYTLYENGRVVAEGWFDSAAEIKAEYIGLQIGARIVDDEEA